MTSTATSTTTRAITATSTRATTVSSRRRARRRSSGFGAVALLILVGWTTFAFAGVYPSTLGGPAVICVALAGLYPPWSYEDKAMSGLRFWIAAILGVTVLQLIPLPQPIIDAVSPAARATARLLSLNVPGALPMTIDEASTGGTLLINAGLAVVFLSALHIFANGGVRTVARGVALMGLVLSAIALAQAATGHGAMYWRWRPLEEGAPPFGPFVNRNHFTTWAVLAIPLTVGYLVAHASAHRPRGGIPVPLRRRIATFFDGRAILLTAAICLLAVATVTTLSRSGMMGLAVSAVVAVALRLGRNDGSGGRAVWWLAAAAGVAAVLIVAATPVAMIAGRLASSHVSASDRLMIWKDTIPMIRDFWLTGTGAGTYETGMLVYQRASPGVRFNQAHNHYMQIAAEGGLLLAGPMVIALAVFTREAWRRLWGDGSGVYWIRAGAFCGLSGVAAQSVWETGLVTPANAALAAVLAAIVLHQPHQRSSRD